MTLKDKVKEEYEKKYPNAVLVSKLAEKAGHFIEIMETITASSQVTLLRPVQSFVSVDQAINMYYEANGVDLTALEKERRDMLQSASDTNEGE